MEVTEVKVFPVNEDKLKAFATLTLDNCFVIRDLKVINGNSGLFVAMPSKKRKDGTFRDIAHPLNNETRQMIERQVLDIYYQEAEKMGVGQDTLPAPRQMTEEGGSEKSETEEGSGGQPEEKQQMSEPKVDSEPGVDPEPDSDPEPEPEATNES